MRRQLITAIVFSVVALGSLLGTLAAGWAPNYGLDLQGGISVVLQPTEEVPNDVLDRAVEIIRNRVDGLGVAEPEIGRQGTNILVQLPGVEDQQRALDLIGTTAELRFRPVLADLPVGGIPTTTGGDGATTTTAAGATTGTATTAATTTVAPTTAAGGTTIPPVSAGAVAPTTTAAVAPTTTAEGSTPTTTAADGSAPTTTVAPSPLDLPALDQITPREGNVPEATVVLPQIDSKTDQEVSRHLLGPAALKGDAIESARAEAPDLVDPNAAGWYVSLVLKGGDNGIDALNVVATACFNQTDVCPTGRLGIELDGRVVFAGNVQSPSFERDQITLSGNYTKSEANDIALALRYGALPINLETQSVQTVSATVGEDALQAGIVAGLTGLLVVTALMIFYYRWFGVLAIASLVLSTALLWAIISWLGETRGLALTLAGVTGLIVSIGVSLDSNIVYYEHIKEDIWNGRTPRSAVDRAFSSAWKTIVKADSASLLGAVVLYFLSVGAVRGFALYLILATVLDLVATYLFLQPAARILARRPALSEHPQRFGLPRPEVV